MKSYMLTTENSDDELSQDKSLNELNIQHTTILSCICNLVLFMSSEKSMGCVLLPIAPDVYTKTPSAYTLNSIR